MDNEITKKHPMGNSSPFEKIKRTNETGNEHWLSLAGAAKEAVTS